MKKFFLILLAFWIMGFTSFSCSQIQTEEQTDTESIILVLWARSIGITDPGSIIDCGDDPDNCPSAETE